MIGKTVHIILKTTREYTAVIEEINDCGDDLVFIGITDKFGNFVLLNLDEIMAIEELKNKKLGDFR